MPEIQHQYDWTEIAALVERLRSFRRDPAAFAALADEVAQALARTASGGAGQLPAELARLRASLQAEIAFATHAARLRDPALIRGAE